MSDRYAVIGNPVAHSRSPSIHARFAAQTGQDIAYGRVLAPLDGFAAAVERFRDEGGCGLNVTLPFKAQAHAWAPRCTARARAARAVNTLRFDAAGALGDNTDGVGLVLDIEQRIGVSLARRSVLLVGAGGAARGVAGPLVAAGVACLVIANRTPAAAEALAAAVAAELPPAADKGAGAAPAVPRACRFDALEPGFDLVVNATSTGLGDARLPIADAVFAAAALGYDMFYAPRATAFMAQAAAGGCARVCDGLGMLVEQAAESFLLWRGVRPLTAPVYEALRAELDATPS